MMNKGIDFMKHINKRMHCKGIRIITVLVALNLAACQTDTPQSVPVATQPQAVVYEFNGNPVDAFHYQLQGINLAQLAASTYDLFVIDTSRDGSAETAFTRQEIETLQTSSNPHKLVLAYLSIGEAEDYRAYWQQGWQQQPPAWLLAENPNWAGNYLVAYWEPAWQQMIFGTPQSYLDQIMAAGFDGVYLDTIDSYQSFAEIEDADRRMADFVINLAAYARRQDADFLIVPQNGIDLAVNFADYRAAIDALGQEDIFYGYPDANRVSEMDFLNEVVPKMDELTGAGVPLLAIAYTEKEDQILDNQQRCLEHQLICFCTIRALDQFIDS
jgi:cysteinyl-tRNA synthetase, unknown class